MTRRPKAKTVRRVVVQMVAFAAGLWLCDRWLTGPSIADATNAATTAPATAPASRPALAADVQAILDRLVATHARTPLRLEAEIVSDFDVAGVVEHETRRFSSSHGGGQRFRLDAPGELLVVGDGAKVHLYDAANNAYAEQKAADATANSWRGLIGSADPVLLMAVTGRADALLTMFDARVAALPSATEGGRTFDRIEGTSTGGSARRIWVDHERGTIDRIETNFAPQLVAQGAAEVKRASVTLRYTRAEFGGPAIDGAQFAFAPPGDATPLTLPGVGEELLADAAPATELEGKPAPPFELAGLDGQAVKLSDHAGSVVVLDFWATWCPPCREGLPHLAETAKRFADRGVRVFAVNVREDAETVRKFLGAQRLDLHALLDANGAVGELYRVSGIPQTVVIGRDGVVRKVIVGFDPAQATRLGEAIAETLD